MALINTEQRRAFNLIVPFGLAGFVFYQGYASKGKTDWRSSGMMALIVFACSYIVITQTTRLLSDTDEKS